MKCLHCNSENTERREDYGATSCNDCGYTIFDETRQVLNRHTHNEELRELVAQWREIGNGGGKHERSSLERYGFEQCADELEAKLED